MKQPRRTNTRHLWALTLWVALAIPGAVRADEAVSLAPVRAAIEVCLWPEATAADRLAALRAAGWRDVDEAGRLTAARALAPGERVFRLGDFIVRPRHDPEVATEALVAAAESLARAQSRPGGPPEAWLALPDAGGYLSLRTVDASGICLIAAPVDAASLAAALDLPVETRPARNPTLTIAEIGTAPEARNRIVHLDFAPGTFSGLTALPQIATPLVRIPD